MYNIGSVAEWLIAPDCRSGQHSAVNIVGSNPSGAILVVF